MSEQVPNKAGNEANSITVGLPDGDIREWLGNTRRSHGADSPIGWRCTNLLEGLERYSKETDSTARQNIAVGIAIQNADLDRLLQR